jgi:hypothetical protein
MLADLRRLRLPISIDYGWFVFFAWPVLLPWHLVQTRGRGGCLALIGFVGLYVVTGVLAIVFSVVATLVS